MISKTALEAAITANSPLTLAQVERLFGGEVNPANKATVWRFLNLTHPQQMEVWQAYLRLSGGAYNFQVMAVR